MGSAASSSKNAVIPLNQSRSDGCQCDTYERKINDLEKKVTGLEKTRDEMAAEVKRLNKILTEVEGEKMDQADTIESLENRLHVFMDDGGGDQYFETVKAKDQIIVNLEKQISDHEAEFTRQRTRWRRKLRHYATQLAEAKHSGAIRVMELRQEVNRLEEENDKLKKRIKERHEQANDHGSAMNTEDSDLDSTSSNKASRDKHSLVVELSQQMLVQSTKIKKLEESLREREHQLSDLQDAMSSRQGSAQTMTIRRGSRGMKTGARQWSGYSHDSGLDSDAAPDSAGLAGRQSHIVSATAASLSPLSERDSLQAAAVATDAGGPVNDEALYREITEDRNWDAASLASSDTVGPSPRFLASSTRPTSARRESAGRPSFDRGRSIILDPDKEYTIDSVLQLTNT